MQRWCTTCQRRREVVDESVETDLGGINFAEREFHVTTLSCGHDIAAATGNTYPRPDGLAP